MSGTNREFLSQQRNYELEIFCTMQMGKFCSIIIVPKQQQGEKKKEGRRRIRGNYFQQ
jgi:hypothetical protein